MSAELQWVSEKYGEGALAAVPTTASEGLREKRIALAFDRRAAAESARDEPWTDRNVRLYQSYADRHWNRRSAILLLYLVRRRERLQPREN